MTAHSGDAQPFTVRRATPEDKEAVLAISRAISDHDFIPDLYDTWMMYADPEGLYVAEQDGRVIACYCLEWHAPGQAYFYAMRLDPAHQGQGIGSRFSRLQVEHARSVGAQEIYLFSVLDNFRAHHMVEKSGFVNRGPWLVHEGIKELPPGLVSRRARWARLERGVADDTGSGDGAAAAPGDGLAAELVDRAADGPAVEPDAGDGPAVAQFLQEHDQGSLAGVIASRYSGWATVSSRPADWEGANVALVEGENGLEGLMLLGDTKEGLLIRWLDGTPEAAADLLGFAGRVMKERGHEALTVSIPLAAESLLVPLGLNPDETFRAYVFHVPPGARVLESNR